MQAARALAKRYRTKLNLCAQLTAGSLLVLFLQRELGDLLLSLSISLSLPLSLPTCELSWWVAIVVIIVVVVVAAAARAPLPMAVAKVLELWVEFEDSTWLGLTCFGLSWVDLGVCVGSFTWCLALAGLTSTVCIVKYIQYILMDLYKYVPSE